MPAKAPPIGVAGKAAFLAGVHVELVVKAVLNPKLASIPRLATAQVARELTAARRDHLLALVRRGAYPLVAVRQTLRVHASLPPFSTAVRVLTVGQPA